MSTTNEKYIVLDVKGVSGLLVSDYVYKPGRIFVLNEWKWGIEALEVAIKNGRCKRVEDKKPEEIKAELAKSEKLEAEKSEKQKKLEAIYGEYMALDPESDKAKKLEDKIKKFEAEILGGEK